MKKEKKIVSSCVFVCCWTAVETWSFITSNFIFPEFRILKSQEKREIKCLFLPSVRWGTLVGSKKQTLKISGQSGSKFYKMSIFWIPAFLCSVANPKNSQNFRNNNSWTQRTFPVEERSKCSETFVFRKWESHWVLSKSFAIFSR